MFDVLRPVYTQIGGNRTRPLPTDQFATSWEVVGQATDMQDAKRFVCRPVLQAVHPTHQ